MIVASSGRYFAVSGHDHVPALGDQHVCGYRLHNTLTPIGIGETGQPL